MGLCFFVLLFSMATMDAQKFEEVAASFSSSFGIFSSGEMTIGDGELIGDGISQLNELSNYTTSMGEPQSSSDSDDDPSKTGEIHNKELMEAFRNEQWAASEKLPKILKKSSPRLE